MRLVERRHPQRRARGDDGPVLDRVTQLANIAIPCSDEWPATIKACPNGRCGGVMAAMSSNSRRLFLRMSPALRFVAVLLIALMPLALITARPTHVTADVVRSDAVNYGGGTYGVIASMFGAPADGLVGNTTASGHILRANDKLVALPACTESSCPWLALSAGPKNKYGPQTTCAESDGLCWVQVYATETGRCTVAPVLDLGPLFVHDNWWDARKDRTYKLPKGRPAAEIVRDGGDVGFGSGYSDRGYNIPRDFSYGPAIDLAAGTWNDLGFGLSRTLANVEVTLLWQAGINHADACNGAGFSLGNASTTDVLNLRAGPGTSHDVIDVFQAGARVLVTGGASNGFYPVDVSGDSGWMSGEFLAPDGGSAGDAMALTSDEVNFRSGPSTADDVIDVLSFGSLVVLTGKSKAGFLSASVGGTSGWVSAQFLDAGDFNAPKQSSPARKTAEVLEDLNLRAGPSTAEEILDVMPAGTKVTVTGGERSGFLPVSVGGQTGWAYALYLGGNNKALADQSATVTEDLNLRSGPSTNDDAIDVMPAGATVTLTGNGKNGFVSVSYGGVTGWAYETYLD